MTNTELIARWTKSDVKQVNQALRRGDDDFDALPWGPVDNRADLRGIRLCGHFKKVRWRNLDLSFCNGDDAFIHVRMSDCLLKRASLGAYCGDVLERCDLSGATLKELSGTFSDCDFTRAVARFVNGHAMAEFLRCDFSEVHFIQCCFPGCRFEDCVWSNARFRCTDFSDAVFNRTHPSPKSLNDTNDLDGVLLE